MFHPTRWWEGVAFAELWVIAALISYHLTGLGALTFLLTVAAVFFLMLTVMLGFYHHHLYKPGKMSRA